MHLLFLDFLKPVGDALRTPFEIVLGFLAQAFDSFSVTHAIGAYGLGIIALTLLIKTLLFPLFQTQLRMTKKTQAEQRKVAPQLAELRKKYKSDPAKLNTEMMALYKEHDINPLGQLAGCLPTLAQLPVLIGLYQAIIDHQFFENLHVSPYFVGLDLSIHATIENPITWILPVLAGLTTFVQSRMITPPAAAPGDAQAAQMAQVTQSMSFMMPLLITFFAFQPYALQGMVLYWIVSNLFSIGQQYTVNGWGNMPFLGNRPKPDDDAKASRSDRKEKGDARANGANGAGRGEVQARTNTQAQADAAEASAADKVRRRQKARKGRRR
ncbi:MAG: YidC/Oxa1 family rane protein insertase [Chloroflexota bacterium]|nr:YidC/Oxa1 family rane protein insertase [Chloroflexota bacterium]